MAVSNDFFMKEVLLVQYELKELKNLYDDFSFF